MAMIKRLLICVALLMLLAVPVMAANTILKAGNYITVSDIDSDFDLADAYAWMTGKQPLWAIVFVPGAADDKCVIKEGTDAGPVIFQQIVSDTYDPRQGLFGGNLTYPILDFSAGTYSANSMVIFILQEKGK